MSDLRARAKALAKDSLPPGNVWLVYVENAMLAFGRECLEEAAKIADEMRDSTYWDDPSSGIAARIEDVARELRDAK